MTAQTIIPYEQQESSEEDINRSTHDETAAAEPREDSGQSEKEVVSDNRPAVEPTSVDQISSGTAESPEHHLQQEEEEEPLVVTEALIETS